MSTFLYSQLLCYKRNSVKLRYIYLWTVDYHVPEFCIRKSRFFSSLFNVCGKMINTIWLWLKWILSIEFNSIQFKHHWYIIWYYHKQQVIQSNRNALYLFLSAQITPEIELATKHESITISWNPIHYSIHSICLWMM